VHTEIVLAGFIVLEGCLAVPLQGFCLIDSHTAAGVITPAKIGLCYRISLLGGFAIPFDCFGLILGHSIAVLVARADMILCRRIALLGGPQVPADGMNFANLDAKAFIVAPSEQPLCLADTKFGRLSPFRQPVENVLANEWPAPLASANRFFTLVCISNAAFSKSLDIGQTQAALRTEPGTVGNRRIALIAFHKASTVYSTFAHEIHVKDLQGLSKHKIFCCQVSEWTFISVK
jgi:hypothetical protein